MKRHAKVLFAIAALISFLLVPSTASATKFFDSFFGSSSAPPSAPGGTFGTPRDIAINDPTRSDGNGTEGWVYVVDEGNNRIQAFDSNQVFQWAIGRGVNAINEVQTVTITGATSGNFTLTFDGQTTANIARTASATTVQTALRNLSTIGANNANVTGANGGPWTVEFTGARGNADQPQMTINNVNLTPAGFTINVATITEGAVSPTPNRCINAPDCKVAGLGSLGGEFDVAQGIDINQTNGHFYIRERNNNRRVQEFTANGTFVRAWGWNVVQEGAADDTATDEFETCFAASDCQGAPALESNIPGQTGSSTATAVTGIAVAPPGASNAGEVFVADPGTGTVGNRHVERFTVPADPTQSVQVGTPIFLSPGNKGVIEQDDWMLSGNPSNTAVDSNGVVYAIQSASATVMRYDTTKETYLPRFSIRDLLETGNSAPTFVGIDPATDHLLVGRASAALGIVEFDFTENPDVVETSHRVDTHGVDLVVGNGFGVNPSTGEYFVSTTTTTPGTGTGARVLILDDTGVDPPPTVTLHSPTKVTGTTATLHATINPNGPTGFPTSYRFQVSKNGVDWTDAGANKLVGATGDGSDPVVISGEVGGLDGNTSYRVRVITTRSPSAGIVASSELVLLTDKVKPEVATLPVQGRGSTTATLTGSIRPNGLSTDYYFEWGKTTAYERGRAPIPSSEIDGALSSRFVQQNIDGLFPSWTFHYRLVASNAEGSTFGNDMKFETRPASPGQAERAYEMVSPPFKVTRLVVDSGSEVGDNAATGIPSLDGEAVAWTTSFFPLSDDVRAPLDGDKRIIRRTMDGWVNKTQNTLPLPSQYSPVISEWNATGSSGDLRSFSCCAGLGDGELIPTTSSFRFSRLYTFREGTGNAGYTAWASDLDTEVDGVGLIAGQIRSPDTTALLNDDGSAMARWGGIRGMARLRPDPLNPGRMVTDTSIPDPSLTQQLSGETGGSTPYIVRAVPDELPSAPRDLVIGCTGTAGIDDATLVPMRNPNGTPGFGSEGDDYLDTQVCVAPAGGPEAAGVGDLSDGSLTISNVSTSSGAFEPGQFISGIGIPLATKIVSVGADTITMSAAAKATQVATGTVTAGSTTITDITPASTKFLPGQSISGMGIPAGTTIVSRGGNFASLALEISQAATSSGAGVAIAANAPTSGASLTARPAQLTNSRGAVIGAGTSGAATALSNDGNRVFFQSPDVGPSSCSAFTEPTFQPSIGPLTNCPAQLYVRQYDNDDDPFVRWISRPQDYGSGAPAAGTGTLTAGSDTVTALTTSKGTFTVGQLIRGNGIPAGTTILATGAGTLTLSQQASASGTLTSLVSGSQEMGQLTAVAFQGASRDGRYVYFRTTSPLLPGDPNNGTSNTIGAAASVSGDLYRYELPADRDTDPDAGSLMRITAGPASETVGSGIIASGSSTLSNLSASSGTFTVGQRIIANGIPAGTVITGVTSSSLTLSANATASGSRTLSASADPNAQDSQPLRFLSDDGQRAYFTTSSPIAGADATPPTGGLTTPTGTNSQTTVRNLYAFDDDASGADRYKFIAAIPYGAGVANFPDALNDCSTRGQKLGVGFVGSRVPFDANCFRGTASGNAVVFSTAGSLTVDDTESNTSDIYLYDIRSDELTRITAQPSDVITGQSYVCFNPSNLSIPRGFCHGDLSHNADAFPVTGEYDKARGWGGMRYENIVEDANGTISVFFETPLQFVPEDVNSTGPTCSRVGVDCHFWDVYEWRNGSYSLISPGDSDDNSWFSGNSIDGRDVFFLTSARIDPREIDDKDFDIYDARIGGGFPYTPPPAPCDVLAHQCRGDISAQATPDANIASSSVGASDNAVSAPSKKAKKKKAKTKKKAKKKQRKSKRNSRNRSGK